MLGSDCRIEQLIGDFACAERMSHLAGATANPGSFLTAKLARSLDVGRGDVVTFPGGQPAEVVDVVDDPRLDGLNDGFMAAGETTNVAVSVAWAFLPLGGWIGSLVLMREAGLGRLSVEALPAATALYSVSTMALTILLAPLLARAVPPLPRRWSWAPMLVRSNLTRSPLRTGFTVTIIALGVSLTFGITTVLGSVKAAIPEGVHDWLADDGILLVGRAVGEPTAPALSAEFLQDIRDHPGVGDVTPMTNLVLDGTYSVFGVPASSRVADRIISDTGLDGDALSSPLARGDVVLGQLAANSAGVGPGDRIELPAATGTVQLRVAAVGVPTLADETGLGRVVEVDYDLAVTLWGAPATSAFVEPTTGFAAKTLADTLPRTGRIRLYETEQLLSDARGFVDRLYTPFILVGRLALVIAFVGVLNLLLLGLLARKQERAALYAVGMTPPQETLAIFGDALMLSGLGATFGIAGGVVFAWGVLLASPLLLATSPPLHVDGPTILRSLGLAVLVCVVGAILPALRMRHLGVPLPQEE